MAKDDYPVVIYKILTYLYQCLKQGVKPDVAQAQKLTGINNIYWHSVVCDCIERGLIRTTIKDPFASSYTNINITFKGVEFLEKNSNMAKVKRTLGEAFQTVLTTAIQAAKLCQ